jgi:NADPH-dependent 2,4-dienoyl-CoA reductase/sulfur reductase-like enzyme
MEFVIIGGDAAGMSAASRTKRNQPEFNVTVFEKTRDVSYSACGMPYNIADPNRDMDDLVVRRAEVFRKKQGINLLTGHCVEKIDSNNRRISGTDIEGKSFEKHYDMLLIATGSSAVIPNYPGCDQPGVLVLKNLEDGRRIKDRIGRIPVKKAVIIGMGYIALEMVEALCAREIGVEMVKPGPVFLPWMDAELAQVVRKEVEGNDVKLHLECAIERIESAGGALHVVGSEGVLTGEMVLVAAGVKPNSELAAGAGLKLGPHRAIAVDMNLKTSDEAIYAAGDCADAYHVVTGQRTWVPLALRANRAGWAVADNVCGTKTTLSGSAGTAVFKVFDLEVARTGLNAVEAKNAGFEPVAVTIQSRSRAHAHPGSSTIWVHMVADRRSGRLLGVQMLGKEGVAHRINAPAVALHGKMTVEEFSQSDLAYAPPFAPVWDPMLTAAIQLYKEFK